MFILNIVILILLLFVAIQDFLYRKIVWVAFPLLFLLFLTSGIIQIGLKPLSGFFLINIGFLVLQLFLITIYYSLKNKRIFNIVNTSLGIGDILFFVILALSFSPPNFIFFLIVILLAILVIYSLFLTFNQVQNKHVPLAGGLAFALLLLVLLETITDRCYRYDDSFILNLMQTANV